MRDALGTGRRLKRCCSTGAWCRRRLTTCTTRRASIGRIPDTKTWDADRVLKEFLAAILEWRKHGLLAIAVNLQEGHQVGCVNPSRRTSNIEPALRASLRLTEADCVTETGQWHQPRISYNRLSGLRTQGHLALWKGSWQFGVTYTPGCNLVYQPLCGCLSSGSRRSYDGG